MSALRLCLAWSGLWDWLKRWWKPLALLTVVFVAVAWLMPGRAPEHVPVAPLIEEYHRIAVELEQEQARIAREERTELARVRRARASELARIAEEEARLRRELDTEDGIADWLRGLQP